MKKINKYYKNNAKEIHIFRYKNFGSLKGKKQQNVTWDFYCYKWFPLHIWNG